MTIQTQTYFRRDIQSLRGLALLAVLLFHASALSFPLGYLGVDVFFVISGFVITPLVFKIFEPDLRIGNSLIRNIMIFYKRRFFRLAPALAFSLVFSSVLVFLFAPIDDHWKFAKQGIATLFLAGNLGANRYAGNYFNPNPNPLIHTWTLSVEEQIYLFLPIVMAIFTFSRKIRQKKSVVFLSFFATLSLISFSDPNILSPLYSFFGVSSAAQFSYYSTLDRFWQFALGGLSYLVTQKGKSLVLLRLSTGFKTLIVILLCLSLFSSVHFNYQASSIAASLLTVFVILSESLLIISNSFLKITQWLGDRSYSIYLLHLPLIYIAEYSPVFNFDFKLTHSILVIAMVALSVLLGSFCYSKIEMPYRVTGKEPGFHYKRVFLTAILTWALPLIIFFGMVAGVQAKYWGLDKSTLKPPYAGSYDLNCLRDSINGGPCIYKSQKSGKQVLLIGDSQAGQISQALVDAAESQGWTAVIWAHSNCPIQFATEAVAGQVKPTDTCIDVNRKMNLWVTQNKPDLIIVAQHIHANSDRRSIENAILQLRTKVPKIVVIQNIPYFPDGKDFMHRRPILMKPYDNPQRFEPALMDLTDVSSSKEFSQWAASIGIATVDFYSKFCSKSSCNRYLDGQWLYSDAGHLSVAGANLLIPDLIKILLEK